MFFLLPVMSVVGVMCFQSLPYWLAGALYCVHLVPSNSENLQVHVPACMVMCILATNNVTLEVTTKQLGTPWDEYCWCSDKILYYSCGHSKPYPMHFHIGCCDNIMSGARIIVIIM